MWRAEERPEPRLQMPVLEVIRGGLSNLQREGEKQEARSFIEMKGREGLMGHLCVQNNEG